MAGEQRFKVQPTDRVAAFRVMTQNKLGTALRSLGERESGTERLEEALMPRAGRCTGRGDR
jgi:hypothetical protein